MNGKAVMRKWNVFFAGCLSILNLPLSADEVHVDAVLYRTDQTNHRSSAKQVLLIKGNATLLGVEMNGEEYRVKQGVTASTVKHGQEYAYASPDAENPGSIVNALKDMRIDTGGVDQIQMDFSISGIAMGDVLVLTEVGKRVRENSLQLLRGGVGEAAQAVGKPVHLPRTAWGSKTLVMLNQKVNQDVKKQPLKFAAIPIELF